MPYLFISEPSVVLNLTIVSFAESWVEISWSRPQDLNGILSNYFIEYKKMYGPIARLKTKALNLVIRNLTAYTGYYISVSGYN